MDSTELKWATDPIELIKENMELIEANIDVFGTEIYGTEKFNENVNEIINLIIYVLEFLLPKRLIYYIDYNMEEYSKKIMVHNSKVAILSGSTLIQDNVILETMLYIYIKNNSKLLDTFKICVDLHKKVLDLDRGWDRHYDIDISKNVSCIKSSNKGTITLIHRMSPNPCELIMIMHSNRMRKKMCGPSIPSELWDFLAVEYLGINENTYKKNYFKVKWK